MQQLMIELSSDFIQCNIFRVTAQRRYHFSAWNMSTARAPSPLRRSTPILSRTGLGGLGKILQSFAEGKLSSYRSYCCEGKGFP